MMKIHCHPSPNFDARKCGVDLIVLHYTGMQDEATALARLCDPAPLAGAYPGPWQDKAIEHATPLGRVSAHYVVGENGSVFQLVDETERAWHAGHSCWEGRGDTNDRAIGIEIVNGGHDFGLPAFQDAQITSVIALVGDIRARHALGADRVVGHSDVAPARKLDPGEKFPWKRLADAGHALWPTGLEQELDVAAAPAALAAFGYCVPQEGVWSAEAAAAVAAFQRRFRPTSITGELDGETAALLASLVAQKQRPPLSNPV